MIHKLAPPYTECTEQQKKEANHSRRVDGNFKKRGNFHMRLVLGTWSRVNLYTPSQNLNSLCKGINQIQSHNLSRRSQHSVLSRLQSWIWLPLWEPWAEIMVHGYGAGGRWCVKGLWLLTLLQRQPAVTFPQPPLTIIQNYFAFCLIHFIFYL